MLGFDALIISKKAAKGQRGRNGVALGQIARSFAPRAWWMAGSVVQ